MVQPYTGDTGDSDSSLFRWKRCDDCRAQLLRWAGRRLRKPADAEDLCQDICLRCRESCSRFRHDSTFSTFLYRIKQHALKEFLRKKGHNLLGSAMPLDDDKSIESRKGGQEQILHNLEVREALSHLTIHNQALLIWKYVHGETSADIAQKLGIRAASVDRELVRARRRFREAYISTQEVAE